MSLIEEILQFIFGQLQSKLGDSIPMTVINEVIPLVGSLKAIQNFDADARLEIQSEIDNVLRKLGLI